MLPETLEIHLRRYGWTFERLGNCVNSVWRSGFQADSGTIPLQIVLTDAFLALEVAPLIAWPLDWQEWPELMLAILEINSDMKMAKLGITDGGALKLSLEMPTVGLDYEALETSLGVLGYYVDEVTENLSRIMRRIGCCRDRSPLI